MRKLSLKLAEEVLSRSDMKNITGGSGATGNWACGCNSGVNIDNVPSCDSSNCNWACTNQGGWTGVCVCAGGGC